MNHRLRVMHVVPRSSATEVCSATLCGKRSNLPEASPKAPGSWPHDE
jgi:hypothetical protein